MWNRLSMADRARYIYLGVRSGITDLDQIKNAYNQYADGGYKDWIEKLKQWRPGIEEDIYSEYPTYDYEGFYSENPEYAWSMLEGNEDAHFTDKYKFPNHPTFSDESIYSTGRTPGGKWLEHNGSYVYHPSQYTAQNRDETLRYLANSGEGYVDDNGQVFLTREDPLGQYHIHRGDTMDIGVNASGSVPEEQQTTYVQRQRKPVKLMVTDNGDVVDENGNKVYNFSLPYWIDDNGDFHQDLLPLPVKGTRNRNMFERAVDSAFGFINDEILMNKDNRRVDNMGKADQRQFFNISPRKVAAGMDLAGQAVTPFFPIAGKSLQAPNTIYDVIDFAEEPSWAGFRSILYDAAGFANKKALGKSLSGRSVTIPSVDIPLSTGPTGPSVHTPSVSVPVGDIGLASIYAGDVLGAVESVEQIIGRDMFSNPVIDPDNIQIGTNPFSIEYQKGVNKKQ